MASPPNIPPVGPVTSSQPWVAVVGAMFGGITLIGLFGFAYIAGYNPAFICNSFTLLAAIFAFGAALAVGFIGGAAGVNGKIPLVRNNIVAFSAVGGIAVFFIAFLLFQSFGKSVCDPIHDQLKRDKAQLESDKIRLAGEIIDLVSQIRAIREEPFIFQAENIDPAVQNIVIKYMDKSGDYQRVKPKGRMFKIERVSVLDPDDGFYLESDMPEPFSKRPIELQRIVPRSNPSRVALFLNLPSALEKPD